MRRENLVARSRGTPWPRHPRDRSRPPAGRRPRSRGSPCASGTSPRNGSPMPRRRRLRAAMPEDVVARAGIGGDEVAHVLDEPEQRHVGPLEHVDRLLGVDQRQVLRRRDDHDAGELGLLEQRNLDVAGARRQVDHEHVEPAPVGLAQQLPQRRRRHRPAPHHRLVRRQHRADRHDLEPVGVVRLRRCRRRAPRACPRCRAASGSTAHRGRRRACRSAAPRPQTPARG